jgi:hypothetical protein
MEFQTRNTGIEEKEVEEREMRHIKMKIPTFQGKSDPEMYLSGKERWRSFLSAMTIVTEQR